MKSSHLPFVLPVAGNALTQALTLATFAGLVLFFILYVRAEKALDRANESRYQALVLAQELRQSSDDLTRMVRSYVVTGEPRFKQHYEDILAIRAGAQPRPQGYEGIYWDFVLDGRPMPPTGLAQPLLERMRQAGFDPGELKLLENAKVNSDALANIERQAMALVETAGADRTVRRERAMTLLHDAAYHEAKARIMRPIAQFIALSDARTQHAVEDAARLALGLRVLFLVVGLMLIFLLARLQQGQRQLLGAPVQDVYAQITRLGSGDLTTPIAVAEGAEATVIGRIEAARAQLWRVEEDLRERESQFRSVFENAGDAIYIHDRHGRILDVNQLACIQTGYDRDELLALNVTALDRSVGADGLSGLWSSNQFPVTLLSSHRRKDGGTFPIEIRISLLQGRDEKLFIAVVRDVSERQAAEVALRESEQSLRDMLATSPIAARIARAGGHEVVFSNQRYAELVDAATTGTAGIDPAAFYAHAGDYEEILNRLGQGGRIYDRLIELRTPGGRHKWTLASYLPIQYHGEAAVLGWFYDITELKNAETQLAEQAQHTRSILDNMIDGVITIDARGSVESFSKAAERIFGYAATEVIGRNINMLMPSPYRENHDSYLRNYQVSGQARIIGSGREVEGLRRDGTVFPLDLAVSQISHQGQPMYVGLVRDITERKRLDRMKSEFVSTVSHELRTPLTAIRGALGLILGGAVGAMPQQAEAMLKIASNNTERLLLLINDILDMQKIESGLLAFTFESVEVMPFLRRVLDDLKSYGEQYQVGFVLTQELPGVRVFADPARLAQVMANLLSNAAKFSPSGAQVEVAVSRQDRAVRLAVTDHGPGIPPEFQSRLFTRFSQADSSDTRSKGGTGLGLAITKAIAEKHGGHIGFVTAAGQGSTFHVDLPVLEDAGDVSAQSG